jgi:hypothetical protein
MSELNKKVDEVVSNQIVLSTKVEGLEKKVGCLDEKVVGVRENVASVKTDTSWIKKLTMALLIAVIGTAVTLGGKFIAETISSTAVAKVETNQSE